PALCCWRAQAFENHRAQALGIVFGLRSPGASTKGMKTSLLLELPHSLLRSEIRDRYSPAKIGNADWSAKILRFYRRSTAWEFALRFGRRDRCYLPSRFRRHSRG